MRVLLLLLLWGLSASVFSQPVFTESQQGFYVILGAFVYQDNAKRFDDQLRKEGYQSAYAYLPSRQMFYVYTLHNQSPDECLREAANLRKQTRFKDAWVRYISEPSNGRDTLAIAVEHSISEQPIENTTVVEDPTETVDTASSPQEIIIPDKVTLGNTEVFLSLYNARNDRVAEGKVQVIDTDRGRLITEVPGNTYLTLPDPKNNSGNLTLICDVVGYRKIQKELNYNNPTADPEFVTEMGTQLVANFELIQYQKGDIRTLYNIYFFNDAAIMMPESKFELNSLLQMMKDNPTFKIKLHGHTNGNYSGKIIKRGPSGDFFSVATDATTTVGTAKQLSESRASVIRDYLIENGVDSSRVEVKAWGGKRPLYDKKGANAKKNIRVEVEIVAE